MPRRIAAIALSFLVLLLAAPAAFAMQPDPSGLWYDPGESGWGLTLEEQGRTMFAVLFVYDAAGHPAWYVADSIEEPLGIDPPLPPGGPFRGTLYRTSGPYFGAPFDPQVVHAAQVGTISVAYPDASGETLSVDYTIDGVHVTKSLQRQTWGDGYTSFSGVFQGAAVVDTQAGAACPFLELSPPLGIVTAFNVVPAFSAHAIQLGWSTGNDTGCNINGTYQQTGQLASIEGTLACGSISRPPPPTMSVSLTGIALTNGAFTARMQVQQGSCTYFGHLGGVRIR